jgi:hypothetical protein
MEYLAFEVEINPWEERTYEIVARAGGTSARRVARFPLGPSSLAARLPALRKALASVDLGAGRARGEDERAVEEFAALLYRFLFAGETQRLLEETRAAAVANWKGLRLVVRVSAADLHALPWEALWDILAFDLKSLRRGLFDLRVERAAAPLAGEPLPRPRAPAEPLRPQAGAAEQAEQTALLRQADAAFYSPDFERAINLYEAALRLGGPDLAQPRENLARARACLEYSQATTSVPPRAAAGFRRAWEVYTLYRFDEALRWLDEAWLLAKDWGIAEWPEAAAFRRQVERAQNAYLNYCEGLARRQEGDLARAIEAVSQAFRADPLEVYRAQLAAWGEEEKT